MLSYEELIYSKEGRIATITLNRPERLNAWTRIMEEEFMTAIRAAADDKSVGCVIVTGAGRGFCAGADIHGWAEGQEQLKIEDEWPPALNTNPSRRASPNVPIALAEAKPVIAAINGPAIGIGLTMALARWPDSGVRWLAQSARRRRHRDGARVGAHRPDHRDIRPARPEAREPDRAARRPASGGKRPGD